MKKIYIDDTIVGISTTISRSAVSIVRLSGSEAINIVNKVFHEADLTKVQSHTIHYGHIYNNETNEVIDEVLVSVFKKPKTYTKEDVVEINCHGGQLVTKLIFDQMVFLGARVAQEGEFTKRAFLNGRIDLTKAEAVMDIIDAESKSALSIANQSLNGQTKQEVEELRSALLNIIMRIYVNIDYPEYDDVQELTNNEIKPVLEEVLNKIRVLLTNSKDAIKLKNGIDTVIVGKPNVGKSSLLNALLKENRAIVTPIPGTTRDIIEAKFNLGSIMINLIDTAGIRKTTDLVEQLGVSRSEEQIQKADLVLMIFDGSTKLEDEDLKLMKEVMNKKHLFIVNKQDLKQEIEIEQIDNPIKISVLNNSSIHELEEAIKKIIFDNDIQINKYIYISNSRQIEKLKNAEASLIEAIKDIDEGQFIDLINVNINEAWNELSEILGETKDTEIIDALFSNFCLGK